MMPQTIEQKHIPKQKVEVWISPSEELFEAIPLFTRLSVTPNAEYKMDIVLEPEKPIAYAIYHPEMSDQYIFISAPLIEKKGTYLSEL